MEPSGERGGAPPVRWPNTAPTRQHRSCPSGRGANSEMSVSPRYLGAIDQGTTSTRFMVFDRAGRCVSIAQREHQQFYPQPGWVEHDAQEILARTSQVIAEALDQAALKSTDLAGVGIANQRETTVLWDRKTG